MVGKVRMTTTEGGQGTRWTVDCIVAYPHKTEENQVEKSSARLTGTIGKKVLRRAVIGVNNERERDCG